MFSFTRDVANELSRKKTAVAVSLDIQKAFDTVWLSGLVYKMIEFDFSPSLVKLLYSYLYGRRFRVAMYGSVSRELPLIAGIPWVLYCLLCMSLTYQFSLSQCWKCSLMTRPSEAPLLMRLLPMPESKDILMFFPDILLNGRSG